MLWTNEQRRGIRAGEITATVRAWEKPQVQAGRRYRWDDEHELAVSAVDRVERHALVDEDLLAAGFESREAFQAALPKFAGARPAGPFFVVRFTLEPVAPAAPAAPEDVEKLVSKLRKLDGLSDHGPWTRAALAVIAEHPRVVSTDLARRVGRERFAFKADVRKLKRLGLTRSHEVGYQVTELGRSVLAAMDAASPAPTEGRDSLDSPSPVTSGEAESLTGG